VITENRDFEELLNTLLDKALTATDAEIGSSFMVDLASRRLRLVGARGIEDLKTGTYINIDDSLIRHVIDEKKALLVKDVENDPRIQKKNNPKYGSPSFLSVPVSMNQKGDVKAVINLSHKKTGESFNANDENVISTMLVEVRLNLENAFLQSQIAEYIKDIENRNYQLEQEIAERKRAEDIQKKLHENLMQAEKMAAVGIFAAGMAHEVKNPLAIIVQGIEYLKSSVLPSDSVSSDIMERIKKSAMRADSIVKGLLSFTHQIPLQKEKAKIFLLIEEALSCIEHKLQSNHITVLKQYSADVPMVYIDSSQIKQVFTSILLNSLEAMENVGTITIRAQETKTTSGQHYIQIIFSDTGCGIPEDEIEKVFDPFYTTKDGCGNAGLGLSISKGIVDKHMGMIRIESTVNQRTNVTIDLPTNTLHGSFDDFKNIDSHVIVSNA